MPFLSCRTISKEIGQRSKLRSGTSECLSSRTAPSRSAVPTGPDYCLSQLKYEGYRLCLEYDGDRVRLITNWTARYLDHRGRAQVRQKRFALDGEAVILGVDGVSDFDALHSGKHNDEVQLRAFDVLALDGDDLRQLPLSMRKIRLLAHRPDGIFVAPFDIRLSDIEPRLHLLCLRQAWRGCPAGLHWSKAPFGKWGEREPAAPTFGAILKPAMCYI